TVGGEVSVNRDDLLLQGDRADEVEEEGLSRSVLADDEPCRRSVVNNPVDVAEQRVELGHPADLDVLLPGAGDDASAQRVHDRVAIPGPDAVGGVGAAGGSGGG